MADDSVSPLNDSDATVMQPGSGILPAQDSLQDHLDTPLPIGCAVQEYVIEGLVGVGGFGIVYLARDTRLGRTVALKEYMPLALATRGHKEQVILRSERQRETFELGLRSFVNEAQLLAAFDQPSLVKVYRFWEQNGTAYMVMPFYEGPTLKQWLVEHGSPPEAWIQDLLLPIMDALEVMHEQRCFHRDISPDNILLLKQPGAPIGPLQIPRPLLLDFGAARRVIGDTSQAFTVILKPGYAPIEQYAESIAMKQGPWTDVYALCAVLYAAIAGKAPQPSAARIVADEMVPTVQVGASRYSSAFLGVIDKGLAVRAENRPQDMAALRALFEEVRPAPPRSARRIPSIDAVKNASVDSAVAVPAEEAFAVAVELPRPSVESTLESTENTTQGIPRLFWLGMAATILVGLIGTGVWLWRAAQSSISAPVLDHTGASSQPVTQPVSPPIEPVVVTPEVVASGPSLTNAKPPFSVVTLLNDVVKRADSRLVVKVWPDKSSLNIGKDRLEFRVKSNESGFLYVLLSSTDKSRFYLLFPNGLDKNNRIKANEEMVLPRKNWRITAGGPAGTNHIAVVVSRVPRDFTDIKATKQGESIPEFDLARAEQLWAEHDRDGTSPFIGQGRCVALADPCDNTYGATLLEIKEVQLPRKTAAAR
jgi:serine/threonine protein kinase